MLNVTINGEAGPHPPVILAHGLFGSGRNLGGLARRLAVSRQVISVDMRNHGESFHDDDHSYAALGADLAAVIREYGGRADLVGHSMGGKAAMVMALNEPDLLRRLAVLDIAPVGYGHSQRELISAMRSIELSACKLRSDADRQLARRVDDPSIRAFLLQSLDLKADPPAWKLNLDVLDAQMDRLVGWPEDLPKARFEGPALFLAGADSDYVSDQGREAIRDYFPQAQIREIEGAGHWLHADKPVETGEILAEFLA
ncbi:MAG: alpha/beta fold hydrolase [Paracoccus sp. (in: a-proteobacteria)]|nr:alpha/beta fold hydrolase [Paracoccus sp. (in: a-proteobacteria)]